MEPVRTTLAGQGLNLTEDQFGGIYYYDLVPGPGGQEAKAEGIPAQLQQLKERSLEELSAHRSTLAKGLELAKNFSGYIVDNFGDIFSYLYLDKTHREVNERVYAAVNGSAGLVHLVGYSLGSIVCYCALMQNEEAARKVAHLIMLGSPLYWFKSGVEQRVGLDSRPAVGRFTNLAGLLDIAWPQAVPKIIRGLDEHREFALNLLDPIKGHQEYFVKEEGLYALALELKKAWQ